MSAAEVDFLIFYQFFNITISHHVFSLNHKSIFSEIRQKNPKIILIAQDFEFRVDRYLLRWCFIHIRGFHENRAIIPV